MVRRLPRTVALLASLFLFCLTAGPAAAFEPPSDPADVFNCPGGEPVPGFPGVNGQVTQFGSPGWLVSNAASGKNFGAWSAALNPTTPVELC